MQIRNPRTGAYDYNLRVNSAAEVADYTKQLRSNQKSWLENGIEGRVATILQLHAALKRNIDRGNLRIDTR